MLHVLHKLVELKQRFMSGLQLPVSSRFIKTIQLNHIKRVHELSFFLLLLNSIQSATV